MNRILLSTCFALLPSFALAHTGAQGGFAAGFAHPFTGPDHMAAMLAIGLWAAQGMPRSVGSNWAGSNWAGANWAGSNLAGAHLARAVWALPLSFLLGMVLGGAIGADMGAGGPFLPWAEPMILASVIILGAGVAAARALPLAGALALAGVFGAAHGLAHGAEMQGSFAPYAAGFALASGALHGAGLAVARALPPLALRGAGLGVLSAGLALALA